MSLSLDNPTVTRPLRAVVADYVALTKPSINRMCLLMVGGGMVMAPSTSISLLGVIGALIGTALSVASANALNMWFERNTDGLMRRTRSRPLPNGRISDRGALVFGLVIGVIGVSTLAITTNAVTTGIGALAIVSYAWVYTPLKYRAPIALVIGAIPGAVPPLMGWTAMTGTLDLTTDAPGLILFAILFVWQMPHFLAISVFRKLDYEAAGIRTVPGVRGLAVTRIQAVLWAAVLIPISLLLLPLGVGGAIYGVTAGVAGLAYLGFTIAGFWATNETRWAYQLFGVSLVYLPVVVVALSLDIAFRA